MTWSTATSSLASTVTFTVPLSTEPAAGDVIVAVGGVVSAAETVRSAQLLLGANESGPGALKNVPGNVCSYWKSTPTTWPGAETQTSCVESSEQSGCLISKDTDPAPTATRDRVSFVPPKTVSFQWLVLLQVGVAQ